MSEKIVVETIIEVEYVTQEDGSLYDVEQDVVHTDMEALKDYYSRGDNNG